MKSNTLLLGILLLGAWVRLVEFPGNPPGLYVDEAGACYESFSLLNTGADRWGIHMPAYFISWGSGQSVLYSYLDIPFIAALGLSNVSCRLPSVFIGILTLPLLYITVKRIRGKNTALLATGLLAILPWHIMISRWALDANLLPCFLLLGTYTVSRALEKPGKFNILIALIPWGLALYAYAMAYIVVPILLVCVVLLCYKTILKQWHEWIAAFGIFSLLALPIGLFLLKNFVVKENLPFEQYLPFGLPLLPISRIDQVSSYSSSERLVNNFLILIGGFQDGEIRNAVPEIAPIFWVLLPLACIGAIYKTRHLQSQADLFLVWLGGCVPLLFPWDMAVYRVNAIFIPMLVIAVYGYQGLWKSIQSSMARTILTCSLGLLIIVQTVTFSYYYFVEYPRNPDTELAFFKGFDRALRIGLETAQPAERILVTDRIQLPYFLTAFFANYPPDKYTSDIRYRLEPGVIDVQSLGRFYFGADNLPQDNLPYVYVLAKWDEPPCANPQKFLETRLWNVGRCGN